MSHAYPIQAAAKRFGRTNILLSLVLVACTIGFVYVCSSDPWSAVPPSQAIDLPDNLNRIAKKHELGIVVAKPKFPVKTIHGNIDGSEADRKDVESYVPIFVAEWGLYPKELIAKTKLRRIIWCKNLSFVGQLRTAIPDFENDDLYLDVGRGRFSEMYVRAVIHHEFFHIIDLRNGTLYNDERWSRLLPKGVNYGRGGRNAQDDPTGSLITERMPGFLNAYSATGVEEDKAEVFAYMIVDSRMIKERSKKDPIIRAKAEYMIDFLKGFCPQMDERFWEASRKVERGQKGARANGGSEPFAGSIGWTHPPTVRMQSSTSRDLEDAKAGRLGGKGAGRCGDRLFA